MYGHIVHFHSENIIVLHVVISNLLYADFCRSPDV